MDWTQYKALCDQPEIWSSWMLTQSAELFAQQGAHDLSVALTRTLSTTPIPVPEGFRGPEATRMYRLNLMPAERELALELIQHAVSEGLSTPATAKRGLGGFREAWSEYLAKG